MDYTGTLLIASPHLEDPNFRMTVVFIAYQAKKQVLGLVLNRASQQSVEDFWTSVFSRPCRCQSPLFIGGPMIGPVIGLRRWISSGSSGISESLSLLVNKEEILKTAEDDAASTRIFLGHAGWTTDQLADEINGGYWHLLPADELDLFSDPSELWLRALERSTRTSLQHLIRLPEFPVSPNNN